MGAGLLYSAQQLPQKKSREHTFLATVSTFADMLATMRLHLWRQTWDEAPAEERNALLAWLLHYISTAMG